MTYLIDNIRVRDGALPPSYGALTPSIPLDNGKPPHQVNGWLVVGVELLRWLGDMGGSQTIDFFKISHPPPRVSSQGLRLILWNGSTLPTLG